MAGIRCGSSVGTILKQSLINLSILNPNISGKEAATLVIKNFLKANPTYMSDLDPVLVTKDVFDVFSTYRKGKYAMPLDDILRLFSGEKPIVKLEEIADKPLVEFKDEQVKRNFIDNVFGNTSVKTDMLNMFNLNITETCFLDLEHGTKIHNDFELNLAIINYHNKLYRQIIDYLLGTGVKVPEHLLNALYIEGESYKNNLAELKKYLPSKLANFNYSPEELELLRTKRILTKVKLEYQAIKSLFILRYFDHLLARECKIIGIAKGQKGHLMNVANKYSFLLEKGRHIATNWNEEDRKSPIDNVSDHTRLIISMLKYYRKGTHITSLDERLNLSSVQYVISLIKNKLYYNQEARKETIYHIGEKGTEVFNYDLSKESLDFIKSLGFNEVTLTDLIALVDTDSNFGYKTLFEILDHSDFPLEKYYDPLNSAAFDIIHSINKGFFTGNNSLMHILMQDKSGYDYFSDATGFLRNVLLVDTDQYYLNDLGKLTLRTLKSYDDRYEKNNLTLKINSKRDDRIFRKKYNAEFRNDSKGNPELFVLTVKNGLHTYEIAYKIKSEVISTTLGSISLREIDNDGNYISVNTQSDIDKLNTYDNLRQFFTDALNIPLKNDENLSNLYIEILARNGSSKGGKIKALQELVALSTHVSMARWVENEFTNLINNPTSGVKETQEDRKKFLLKYFNNPGSKNSYKINDTYLGLDYIDDSLIPIIEDLATAFAFNKKANIRSNIRTADGSLISSMTSSTLQTTRKLQLAEILRDPDPRKTLHELVRFVDDSIIGLSLIREYNGNVLKKAINFNLEENITASLVYDYFSDPEVVHFVEAVNSDKPNVPKISVSRKTIERLIASEGGIYAKINEVIGGAYKNIIGSILDDLNVKLGLNLLYSQASFDAFNAQHRYIDAAGKVKYNSAEFIMNKVMEYNNTHRLIPLAVQNNVHFRTRKDGSIEVNKAFIDVLNRFSDPITASAFWKKSNLTTIDDILDSNVKIDLLTRDGVKINPDLYDKLKQKEWIDPYDGSLIYMKIRGAIKKLPSELLNLDAQGNINLNNLIDENLYIDWNIFLSIVKLYYTNIGKENVDLNNTWDVVKTALTMRIVKNVDKKTLILAALLHDLGKPFNNADKALDSLKAINEIFADVSNEDPSINENLLKLVVRYHTVDTNADITLFEKILNTVDDYNVDRKSFISTLTALRKAIMIRNRKLSEIDDYNTGKTGSEILKEDKENIENKFKIAAKNIAYLVNPKNRTTLNVRKKSDLINYKSIGSTGEQLSYNDPDFDITNLKLNFGDEIEINPVIKEYNAAHYLFVLSSVISTNGLHVYSDAKGLTNTFLEEAGAWNDFNKRNVENTAAIYPFDYTSRNGIPEEINVASLSSLKENVFNVIGDQAFIKPHDGATFVNAFMVHWENDATHGKATGVTKKPFIHFFLNRYANAGVIKTASFGITNEKMSNSVAYRRLMWKASDHEWLNNRGEKYNVNLLEFLSPDQNTWDLSMDNVYFEENGQVYKIQEFKYLGNNTYKRTAQLMELSNGMYMPSFRNEDSIKTNTFVIDSNYKFWKALGGYNSRSINANKTGFNQAETSIKMVADAANIVGYKLNPDLSDLTLRNFYLPLKHSDIHYMSTVDSIKKGSANLNSVDRSYFSNGKFNFFKINMRNAGILLDPTHLADNSEVSLMTQVISGLADRGFTSELVSQVYNALGRLANLTLNETKADFEKYLLTKDKLPLQLHIAKIIVDSLILSKSLDNNILEAIASRILEKVKDGDEIAYADVDGLFPLSDSSIFPFMVSAVTSTLNKMAIKIKMFGSLSVLNPSNNMYMLYGNKKLEEFKNDPTKLIAYHKLLALKPVTIADIDFGRTYTYVDTNTGKRISTPVTIKNPNDYWILRNNPNISPGSLRETVCLYDYNPITNIQLNDDRIKFGFYFITRNIKGLLVKTSEWVEDTFDNTDVVEVNTLKTYPRNLGTYNVKFNYDIESGGYTYNIFDLKSILDSWGIELQIRNISEILKQERNPQLIEKYNLDLLNIQLLRLKLRTKVQDDLLKLLKKQTVLILHLNESALPVVEAIKVNNIEEVPYEVILSKIYQSKFGLEKDDNLSDILLDKDFFYKRALKNYSSALDGVSDSEYDIQLKTVNGKHIYIANKGSDHAENAEKSCLKLDVQKYRSLFNSKDNKVKGKIYRYNGDHNDIIYEMSSADDEVLINDKGTEIIVTDNPEFYIKSLEHVQICVSRDSSEKDSNIIKSILNKVNPKLADLYEDGLEEHINSRLLDWSAYVEEALLLSSLNSKSFKENFNAIINNRKPELIITRGKLVYNADYIFNQIKDTSTEMYTSFIKSLDLVAARIPAQSMQSFMSMRVAGFSNTGVNDCYVSDMQIWLQGSDFDVDKATMMGFEVTDKGKFIVWSPYMNLKSKESLALSEVLPFPTGQKIEAKSTGEGLSDIEKSTKKDLFKKIFDKYFNTTPAINKGKIFIPVMLNGFILGYKVLNSILVNQLPIIERLAWYNQMFELLKIAKDVEFIAGDKETTLKALAIVKAINDHNTFADNNQYSDSMLLNFIASKAFDISKNVANIIPSQTPIDMASQPLKDLADTSKFGKKDIRNMPGNFAIYAKALGANQTGKNVIAIVASTGVKCYFALSLFYNEAIRKGDIETIKKLHFNVNINGKSYNLLANTNKNNLDILKAIAEEPIDLNAENRYILELQKSYALSVIDELTNSNLTLNTDMVISALLTLATDNAKELKLAKLNAGEDMADLYLYGLIIGMPFNEIFTTMTSKAALIVSMGTKENVFTNKSKFGINNVINYYSAVKGKRTSGPLIQYSDLDINVPKVQAKADDKGEVTLDAKEEAKLANKEAVNTYRDLFKADLARFMGETLINRIKEAYSKDYLYYQQTANNNFANLKLLLTDFYEFRKKYLTPFKYIHSASTYNTSKLNSSQLRIATYFERLENFIHNTYILCAEDPNDVYYTSGENPIRKGRTGFELLETLRTLLHGKNELAVLKLLLGLNQGVKSLIKDKLKFIDDFSQIFEKRLKDYEEEGGHILGLLSKNLKEMQKMLPEDEKYNGKHLISLALYCNNEEYKKLVMDTYEMIKHTFNPFRVIENIPHFKSYLETAGVDLIQDKASLKFDLLTRLFPRIRLEYHIQMSGSTNTFQNYYKRLENFISNFLINKWLRTQDKIVIEKGNTLFDNKGKGTIAKSDFSVQLGTEAGNATFKEWMEQEVIPTLQSGRLGTGPNAEAIKVSGTNGNTFIRDLLSNANNFVETYNNTNSYTLPIDMIPKSEVEQVMLDEYKTDFMKLSSMKFNNRNALTTLFFYYNLITYRNEMSQNALTAVTESLYRLGDVNGVVDDYRKYIAYLDTYGKVVINYGKADGDYDIDINDVYKSVAPSDRDKGINMKYAERHKFPYIRRRNKDTLKFELHKGRNVDENMSEDGMPNEDDNVKMVWKFIEDTSNIKNTLFTSHIPDEKHPLSKVTIPVKIDSTEINGKESYTVTTTDRKIIEFKTFDGEVFNRDNPPEAIKNMPNRLEEFLYQFDHPKMRMRLVKDENGLSKFVEEVDPMTLIRIEHLANPCN